MALERDSVLADSKEPEQFAVREATGHDIVPDVIQNVRVGGLCGAS